MGADLNFWIIRVNLRVFMAAMSWQWISGFEEVDHMFPVYEVDVHCSGLV